MPQYRFPKWILCFSVLAALSLSSCGMELGWPEPAAKDDSDSTTQSKLRIFVTDATTDGKIGSGGVGQADSFCEQDANKPDTGTYRALLSDGSNRVALPLTQRKDWVLAATRTYIRPDGTVIGTTTSQAVFAFPLKASIDKDSLLVWTGTAGSAWTSGLGCTAWTKDGTVDSGIFGYSDRINSEALVGATGSCDVAKHLYCVEQPALDEDE
jgi:hypothetical protein